MRGRCREPCAGRAAGRTTPAPSRPWTPSAGVGSPQSSSRTSCRQKARKAHLRRLTLRSGDRYWITVQENSAYASRKRRTNALSARLPGRLVERPGVGDDVVQVGAGGAPAQLAAGLVAGGDARGRVAWAAGRELDRDRAPG